MTFLIYYVIFWIVGLAAMFVTGSTKDISSAAYILLLYQLTVTVGLTGRAAALAGMRGLCFRSSWDTAVWGWVCSG